MEIMLQEVWTKEVHLTMLEVMTDLDGGDEVTWISITANNLKLRLLKYFIKNYAAKSCFQTQMIGFSSAAEIRLLLQKQRRLPQKHNFWKIWNPTSFFWSRTEVVQ